MSGRSLGWIQKKTLNSTREKSSQVDALEESKATAWIYGAQNRGQNTLADAWEECQVDPGGESVLQERKIISGS